MSPRALVLAGAGLLLCTLVLAGCTQPVIPSPFPETTQAPVTTVSTAAATPAATTSQVTPKGQDWLTYTNTPYGFSLSYPAGWTRQENVGTSVVVFTSPSTGMGDIPATMRISMEDLTLNPMSLEQYKAAQLAKKQGVAQFNLIYDQAYKGNNFGGWKVAYTGNTGTLMEWVEVYVIKSPNAYTLTYSSKEDRYASYVVQMDNMFKTFQLTY
ncbi:MAG TPA: PsbP-related protein [Methanomicrobiales archaeon]|jgi:hypothetical protein|nr:PsbP-related protein [Methanomicrobiales archaeon]